MQVHRGKRYVPERCRVRTVRRRGFVQPLILRINR